MTTYEACASVSDPTGKLLFYTNGEQAWDGNNSPMPNGGGLLSHESASQGALILPDFTAPDKYYLFTVDACENELAAGLRYSVVDMALRGGLGDIGPRKNVAVRSPRTSLTEKLTAVRHANGRDYWIVVHGWQTNEFYSYLFTAAGIAATPRVSAVGAVHQGGGGARQNANAVGQLKASPNGRVLACAIRDNQFQIFDFDPATGAVTNARTPDLSSAFYHYGAEFSPDGTKVYTTDLLGNSLYQIDLADNMRVVRVATVGAPTGAVQRGPDGQLYVAMDQASHLGVIARPNNTGPACGFIERAVPLNGGFSRVGLPNSYEVRTQLSATITGPLAICVGNSLSLTGAGVSASGAATLTWDFGDPASGAANIATGTAVTHQYATAGSYVVTLSVNDSQERFIVTQIVTVNARLTLSLGSRQQQFCAGSTLTLSPTAQPAGTSYRWQDNSTSASYQVTTPGRYRLEVTSPQGCTAKDSVEVVIASAPVVRLRPDTVLCAGGVIMLQAGSQPAGSTYRWQDGSTGASLSVHTPGTYSVEVRNAANCVGQDSFVALPGPCPFIIPNVITPNGDRENEYFVLKGLVASAWNLVLYNRWGKQVFRQSHYDNRWNAAGQPAGIYYYLLENPTTSQRFKGWVEVIKAEK